MICSQFQLRSQNIEGGKGIPCWRGGDDVAANRPHAADGRRPENLHSVYEDGEVIHQKRAFKESGKRGAWADEDLFTTIFNPLKRIDAFQTDHPMGTGETLPHSNEKIGPACIQSRPRFVFKDLPEVI
jgi:hypothetical protein